MKHLYSLLIPSLLLSNNLYISTHVGTATTDTLEAISSNTTLHLSDTLLADVALGYDYHHFKLEAEYLYESSSISALEDTNIFNAKGKLNKQHYFANIAYSFTNYSQFVTTLGAGVGYSQVSLKDYSVANAPTSNYNVSTLSYKPFISLGYKLTTHCLLEAKYSYIISNDIELNTMYSNISSSLLQLGIVYNF